MAKPIETIGVVDAFIDTQMSEASKTLDDRVKALAEMPQGNALLVSETLVDSATRAAKFASTEDTDARVLFLATWLVAFSPAMVPVSSKSSLILHTDRYLNAVRIARVFNTALKSDKGNLTLNEVFADDFNVDEAWSRLTEASGRKRAASEAYANKSGKTLSSVGDDAVSMAKKIKASIDAGVPQEVIQAQVLAFIAGPCALAGLQVSKQQ